MSGASTRMPTTFAFPSLMPTSKRVSGYRILRTDRGFRVLGNPPPAGELEAALRAAGARKGAEVEVGGETLIVP